MSRFDRSWLEGAEAKLDRAIEHVEAVERESERFLHTKPYAVTAEFEPETRDGIVRFRVRKRLPLRTSVLVGEVVHDLRSALEHVVWALAAARAENAADLWKSGTRERITFPVAKTFDQFKGTSVRPFIGDDAMAALQGFQPYSAGNKAEIARHPLLHLHDLWNVDKHRVLIGAAGTVDLRPCTFRPAATSFEEMAKGTDIERLPFENLEDGTPLARVRFRGVHQPGSTAIYVQGEPAVTVEFRGGERVVTAESLRGLAAHVADVLNGVLVLCPPELSS